MTQKNYTDKAHRLRFSQKLYRFIKAWLDFFTALSALIVLSPLFLVVAIAIKVDSKGPVFFTQNRIGKGGKLFKCIKFRSMSVEARHDIAGYEYAEVQSYITKVGAVIRKLSIDELPQLFNILAFQMSLIGFRPSQPSEHELNDARESYDMYQIRPGISGWAQVNGRDVLAAQPKKKAMFDAYYLEHFSLWLDIKIFFMTVVHILKSSDVEEGILEVAESTDAAEAAEEVVEAAEDAVEEALEAAPVAEKKEEYAIK